MDYKEILKKLQESNITKIENIHDELDRKGLSFDEKSEVLLSMHLNESSLSRIWQMVEEDKHSFGVISPFRKGNDDNDKNYDELKKDVKGLGLGFVEMLGGYEEKQSDKSVVLVQEKSLFIPKIKKKDLLDFGKKYDQDSVIYKDSSQFAILSTSPRTGGVGKVLLDFKKSAGKDNVDLAKEAVKEFFSALLKGSHKGKKFVFKPNMAEGFSGENGYIFSVKENIGENHLSKYYSKNSRWYRVYEEYGSFE